MLGGGGGYGQVACASACTAKRCKIGTWLLLDTKMNFLTNDRNYIAYTKHLPPEAHFGPFCSAISTVYNSTLTTMLSEKEQRHCQKFKVSNFTIPLTTSVETVNLKFHNSLNNFGEHPPQEYAWFWGVNLLYTLRKDAV